MQKILKLIKMYLLSAKSEKAKAKKVIKKKYTKRRGDGRSPKKI